MRLTDEILRELLGRADAAMSVPYGYPNDKAMQKFRAAAQPEDVFAIVDELLKLRVKIQSDQKLFNELEDTLRRYRSDSVQTQKAVLDLQEENKRLREAIGMAALRCWSPRNLPEIEGICRQALQGGKK